LSQQLNRGIVTIFTGDGKGKTTAAIGTIVRAAGHGMRSFVVFFLKGRDFIHGEMKSLAELPSVDLADFGQNGWVDKDKVSAENTKQAHLALEAAKQAMLSGGYNIIVLDEVNVALDYGLLKLEQVTGLIEKKPPNVELILTGRHADPRLVQMADLVTEMLMIKHPYSEGVEARQGIDY
jgi:cob(I)alamin adenosyltransferase